MFTESKFFKTLFLIFTSAIVIGIGTSIITDLVLNNVLSWSVIVLGASIFSWLVISPIILLKKMKAIASLSMVTVFTIPLLFIAQLISPVKGWVVPFGIQMAILSIVCMWLTYLVVKIKVINSWFKSGVIVFLFGVVFKILSDYFINNYQLSINQVVSNGFVNMLITIIASVIIAVLLCIIGYYANGMSFKKPKLEAKTEPIIKKTKIEIKPETATEAETEKIVDEGLIDLTYTKK